MESIINSKKRKTSDYLTTRNGQHERPAKRSKHKNTPATESVEKTTTQSGLPLSAAQKTFKIYELVEEILLQLPHRALLQCRNINRTTRSLAENSLYVRQSIFGNLPPDHNLIWKVKTLTNYPGPRRLLEVIRANMYFHPTWTVIDLREHETFYTIPVVLNNKVMMRKTWNHLFRSRRRRTKRNRAITKSELWNRIKDGSRPSQDTYSLVMDIANLDPESTLMDEFLTRPAVTDVEFILENLTNPNAIYSDFRIIRAEGVRVRDIIAEVAKAGEDWVKQLTSDHVQNIFIIDRKVSVVSQSVYDIVRDEGFVHERKGARVLTDDEEEVGEEDN